METMSSKAGMYTAVSESVPVNLIRQWYFCNRIPFYQEMLGSNVQRPVWVDQGELYELLQRKLFKRRNLSRFNLNEGKLSYNYNLASDKLPFHGIADIVIESEAEVHVVEIKLSNHEYHSGIEAQLTALSLLAGEVFDKPSDHAFVLYGDDAKVRHLEISRKTRECVLEVADRIIKSLSEGSKPPSSAQEKQCTLCEYINYCNDR